MMIVIDKLDGIEEYALEQMKEGLERLVSESFCKVLNLSRLDYLYFPNDFDKAVLEFQIEQGMSERGSTNNAMGTAFGKTMEVEIDGELKDRVFLRKEILLHLFYGEEDNQTLSMNTIHHELCHVHEHNDLENMVQFQKELDVESNNLDSVLNAHAMNLFSEYVVPKMAVPTKNQDTIVDTSYLAEIIDFTQKEMKKEIDEFHNGELDALEVFGKLQLKTSHLLKVLSTVIGEIDGIAKETAIIYEQDLDSFIGSYHISECYLALKSALRELNITYPNWKQVTDIQPLKNCILQTWNKYNVYPTKYGIRIL
ncbi:Uncharacterised protein [Lysinibacillus sphaericus]|nr:Uncharacterised protein [Lysinibacillus sphaericus]